MSQSSANKWNMIIPATAVAGFLMVSSLRSAIIPITFEAIRRTVNPIYSHPACLMKMVRETVPDHYFAHPFYSSLEGWWVNSTQCDLHQFVNMQFQPFEYNMFQSFLFLLGIASICVALGRSLSWRPLVSWQFVVTQAVNNSLINVLLMSYAHFAQDIIYICGNIMHHCDISSFRNEANASLVKMTPHGFAWTSILTILWGLAVQYLIVQNVDSLRSWYNPSWIGLQTWLSLMNVIYQVKTAHPRMHEIATPEMLQAPIWSFEWRAAQHVFVHHGNGDAFGPSFIFDPIFSVALYLYGFLHNTVFGLTLGSWSHYVFAITFDVGLGMVVGALIMAVYVLTHAAFVWIVELWGRRGVDSKEASWSTVSSRNFKAQMMRKLF